MESEKEWYEEEREDSDDSEDSEDEDKKRNLNVIQSRLMKLGIRQGALEIESSAADKVLVDFEAFKEGFEESSNVKKEKIVQVKIELDEDRVFALTLLRMRKSCFCWLGGLKDTPRLSQMNLSVPFAADRAVTTPLLGGTDRFRYVFHVFSLSLSRFLCSAFFFR